MGIARRVVTAAAVAAVLAGGAAYGGKLPEGAATFELVRSGLQRPRIDPATSPLFHPGFEVFAATGGVYLDRALFDLRGARHAVPVTLHHLSPLEVSFDGPYGRNVWLSLHSFLTVEEDGDVTLHDVGGRADVFAAAGEGYVAPPGLAAALVPLRKGTKVKGWTLQLPDLTERFYDSKGRWKTWTRPDGQVVKFKSGSDLRLKSVQTPEKRKLSFKYGKDRRLATLTLWDKRVFAFAYDARGNLVSVARPQREVDDEPRPWRWEYDAQDRVAAARGSDGGLLGTVAYSGDGRVASITDFAGKSATFQWDSSEMLGTDRDGAMWGIGYDPNGQLLTRNVAGVGEGAESETFTHDALLRRIAHDRPGGDRMEWEFVTETDPRERGNVATFRHLSADRPQAAPDEIVTTNTFLPGTGLLASETRPGGGRTDFAWDGGLLVAIRGPQVLTPTGLLRPETRWEHDAFGRRVATVHPDGSRDHFTYAKKPRDLLVEHAQDTGSHGASLRTRYRYDASGNLVETLFDDGTSRRQTVDAWDLVTSTTEGRGVTTTLEYDAAGRVVSMSTPLRDADGGFPGTGVQVLETEYDAVGRVLEEHRRDGFFQTTTTSYVYATGIDMPTRITLPGGAQTTVTYDPRRRRTSVQTSDEASPDRGEAFAYDAFGNVSVRSGGPDGTVRYEYDGLGRLERVIDGLDGETVYGRDADGRVLSETVLDDEGVEFSRTRYAYDPAGNLVATERDRFDPTNLSDPGVTETWTTCWTLRGVPAMETDACGATVTYAYDGLGRVVSIVEAPLGREREFEYDALGRLALRREIRGAVTRETGIEYDDAGNVVRAMTPEGDVTFGRDSLGRATVVTEPGGRTRTSVIDAAHRRLSTSEPDPAGGGNLVRTWWFDERDRLIRTIGADSVERTYAYDGHGRLTGEAHGGTTLVSYAYDSAGRIASRTDAAGTAVTFAYDALGRVVGRTAFTGEAQTFQWDRNHRLVSGSDQPSAGGPVTVQRKWDSLGNRLLDVQPGGGVERTYGDGGGAATMTTPEGWVYEYHRDAAGRVTTVERDGLDYLVYQYLAGTRRVSARSHEEMDSSFTYSSEGRLVRAEHDTPAAPAVSGSFDATYDARGRRLIHERNDGKGERFEYDAAGRLVRHFMESDDPASAAPAGFVLRTDFAWTPGAGRPASMTLTDAAPSAKAGASATHPFAFDGAGRMTSGFGATLGYDAAGRASNMPETRPAYDAGLRNLTWDAFGRVTQVRRASNASLLGSFAYDVLDRPVLASEEQFTGVGILARRRVFDGCRLVSERSPLLKNPSDGWDLFYVPDPAGRGHLASGFNDTFYSEYLWQTDCRDMPGHLFILGGTALNESYRLWSALGLPHFQNHLGAPFRGAPSLQTATNPPGLAASHATGLVFSWGRRPRDPGLPRPLDPLPWGRERLVPFPFPPGPAPGPGGGDVGDPEADWEEVVNPEDLVEDNRCEDAVKELESLLATLGRARDRARSCGEDLDRVNRMRANHLAKLDLVNEGLDEILETQEDLRKWLDRIRTADFVMNSADTIVGAAKQAAGIKGSAKNLGTMGKSTAKLFGGATGKAADQAMDQFAEAFVEEVSGLVSGEIEGALTGDLQDAVTGALEDAGVLDDAGFSTIGAYDALARALGKTTTSDLMANLANNFQTGIESRRALKESLDLLDRIERDRLGFKEYLRKGTADLCNRANQILAGLGEAWGDSTAGPYRGQLQDLKAQIAAATAR